MDAALKRELIVGAATLCVPVVQAAVQNHYTMKQIDKRGEIAVQAAERRANGFQTVAGGGVRRQRPVSPSTFDDPGDVYDELESLRSETDCSFCHSVIENLMDAPPSEARGGYDELRSYVREVERIEDQGVSQGEAEQIVGDLVDRWEVVPKYVSGAV